jgi:hypothetical protein
MMFLRFDVMDVVTPPQNAPLGVLASGKLHFQCLVVHPLFSRCCLSPLAFSAWRLYTALLWWPAAVLAPLEALLGRR